MGCSTCNGGGGKRTIPANLPKPQVKPRPTTVPKPKR